jgi:hypothetical protein
VDTVSAVFKRGTTIRYFNGGVIHYALDPVFFARFDPATDKPILDLLITLERTLTASGDIPPILAAICARKCDAA